MGNFNGHHKSGWYAVSFGPCRKLPGIFSYRVITRRRISRRACAHARSACAEGSSETFFNVTFVCLFVCLFRVKTRLHLCFISVIIKLVWSLEWWWTWNAARILIIQGKVWLITFEVMWLEANRIEVELRCYISEFFLRRSQNCLWILIFKLIEKFASSNFNSFEYRLELD